MSEAPDLRQDLAEHIQTRRGAITLFLQHARPRRNRLANLSVVGSAVAAVLTAGPAIGGQSFTSSVQERLGLADDSVVWRVLCLLALIFSLGAAISTNLSNSRDLANRVSAAETCNAELEALQTSLAFGQLPLPDAVRLYQQYIAKVPFVEDPAPAPR
ncbi:hypothetical protein IV498_08905 [Paenarthrobacter sp. Z7-10]|uniref:hypothetical protein n=1 Tax=Paenarthrobacter sp. Z7-10 TaxID=2787635 RepID=UPI0022A9272D|nr:hypothetical protein [Paenarthrobacter sp. Z7-10]MCZ2403297.1 hypothetical protein [Paenarthrobacter sp. Z7-10]